MVTIFAAAVHGLSGAVKGEASDGPGRRLGVILQIRLVRRAAFVYKTSF
jgi:hypothetical protein